MKYHKYSHILQPVKVGKLILKNRLINAKSMPAGGDGMKAYCMVFDMFANIYRVINHVEPLDTCRVKG